MPTIELCAFGKTTVAVTYDAATGRLQTVDVVNPGSTGVVLARIMHTSGRTLMRKLAGPGETVSVAIPAPLAQSAGRYTAADTLDDGKGGWAGVQFGFQFIPVTHPENS